jgi:hypothetical protein
VANNHTETAWILLFVTIAIGLVVEDWGARIENALDENAEVDSKGEHFRNWYAYLRTCFESDPVGRRYTRTLVLRLKFELGMAVAMLIGSVGILWLLFLGLRCATGLILLGMCLGMGFLQYAESKRTHEVLARNRAELLKPIRVVSGLNPHPPIDSSPAGS